MKPRPVRLCIYPKDIQRITGKSERYSRNLIDKIRASLPNERHQAVTVKGLCDDLGLAHDDMQGRIIG